MAAFTGAESAGQNENVNPARELRARKRASKRGPPRARQRENK